MRSKNKVKDFINKEVDPKEIDLAEILPFRDPFLFLDKLISYDLDSKKLVAEKRITGKEWFFKGHFPGNPIMPGHIIAEAMVQAGSLLFGQLGEKVKNKIFYLSSSKIRFYRVVKPKDVLRITAYPVKVISYAGIVKSEVYVGKELVAKGEFTLALKKEDDK